MRILAVILAGVVGAGVLGAAGFAMVRTGLPPSTPAQSVAARASVWLQGHRLVLDEFRVDGRRVRGACLRGWHLDGGGSPARGSFLVLTAGTVWFGSSIRRVALLRGPKQSTVVGRLEATAGCTRQLRDMLFAALQTGLHVGVTASARSVDGEPALVLSLPEVRGEQMTLYVSAHTYRPLMAAVEAGSHEVLVRLRFIRATPAILARLHLTRLVQGGHRG